MRIRGFSSLINRPGKDQDDLGFGTRITESGVRLINRDGSFNIERKGHNAWHPYLELVDMNWASFILVVVVYYLGINAFFGVLFLINGIENLPGSNPGTTLEDFAQSFYFSVQTFTTVGYGSISPKGIGANMLATFNALTGLMSLALATGLFFARFSKPKAQIRFSKCALLTPYNGLRSFQFRIVNLRNNSIIDVEARVFMSWVEKSGDRSIRRFNNLKLERNKITLFPLNWNIVHPIDQESPLFEKSIEELRALQAEFIIQIKGYDETFAQLVHTTNSYTWEELKEGHKFKTMYHSDPKRGTILYLDDIDEIAEISDEEE